MKIQQATDKFLSILSWVDSNRITNAKQFLAENYLSPYGSPPHFSVLLVPFPEEKISDFSTELESIFSEIHPFSLSYSGLKFDEDRNFFYLSILHGQIEDLHMQLLKAAQPFRGKLIRRKDQERMLKGTLDKQELELIRKYGYARTASSFYPHITIGSIESADADVPEIRSKILENLGDEIRGTVKVESFSVQLLQDNGDQVADDVIWTKNFQLF